MAIQFVIEIIKLLFSVLIVWLIYKDTNRIIKIFFRYAERKFLVIQSLKLGFFLWIVHLLKRFIPYYQLISFFILILIFTFMALFTVRQITLRFAGKDREDNHSSEYKTFKYRNNRWVEYALKIFAFIMNIGEFIKNKKNIRIKSKEIMYIAVLPLQKYVAVSFKGVAFSQRKRKFISEDQLNEINSALRPGDILLKRNDWQATNLGIKGFWTHSGMYIGSLEEMDAYFSDIKALNGSRFSEVILNANMAVYCELEQNHTLKVIEAIEEGVVLKPLSNIAKVDYFSALRPRVSKEKKMKAILAALMFVGKPYDFHFDMDRNDAFFCAEVIKKAYDKDLTMPVNILFGKKMLYPNSFAKKYVWERKRNNRQLDFVLFYDLNIRTRKAYKSTEKEFIKSYKRRLVYYKRMDMLRYLGTTVEFRKMDD